MFFHPLFTTRVLFDIKLFKVGRKQTLFNGSEALMTLRILRVGGYPALSSDTAGKGLKLFRLEKHSLSQFVKRQILRRMKELLKQYTTVLRQEDLNAKTDSYLPFAFPIDKEGKFVHFDQTGRLVHTRFLQQKKNVRQEFCLGRKNTRTKNSGVQNDLVCFGKGMSDEEIVQVAPSIVKAASLGTGNYRVKDDEVHSESLYMYWLF